MDEGVVSAGANRLLLPRYEVTPRDFERFPERIEALLGASPGRAYA